MDNFLFNLKGIQARIARADARIALAVAAYFYLAVGILLSLVPIPIDGTVIYEMYASRYRGDNGELSTNSAWLAFLLTSVTLIAVIAAVHMVLDRVPAQVWNSSWMLLAGLVVVAMLAQQLLHDYHEIAVARVPPDASFDIVLEESLAVAEWQAITRLPFFLAAIVVGAWGTLMVKVAILRLRHINRLKAARRQTQDAPARYNRLHLNGTGRDRSAAKRRGEVSAAVTQELFRLASQVHDSLMAYLRGDNLGRTVDTDLIEALRPDETPVSSAVRRVAQDFAPPHLNLALLPSDAAKLAPETREAIRSYAAWIQKTFNPARLKKDLM